MLDGVCAGIDCGLYAGQIGGVHSDFEMLPVCLFDYRCKFRHCEIFIRRNLDHVNILKCILANCFPRSVCPVNQQEFLLRGWPRQVRDSDFERIRLA